MLWRLFLAFTIIPLVELYLLVRLTHATSLPTTIALVLTTGLIGSLLARREGTRAWSRFRSAVSEGRMPAVEIQDGLLIAFAAALLLTPGLLTDIAGFLLLMPWTRAAARRYLATRLKGRFQLQMVSRPGGTAGGSPDRWGDVIDAEGVRPVQNEPLEPRIPPDQASPRG